MKKYISRRNFVNRTIGAGAGALILPTVSGFGIQVKKPD